MTTTTKNNNNNNNVEMKNSSSSSVAAVFIDDADDIHLLRQDSSNRSSSSSSSSPKGDEGLFRGRVGRCGGNDNGSDADVWRGFFIVLTLAAGIGGFLFGYDTGVISGALLYIREEFEAVDESTVLQETIVSTAIGGAALGAAFGGRTCDRLGRKKTILVSDLIFIVGSIILAAAPSPSVLVCGRVLVGLGIGVASIASPLYIAETSPSSVRGALVSVNILMVTTGQLVSYLLNYAFTTVPGTWRWMLGIAGVPAVLQLIVFTCLPESPQWLVRKGYVEDSIPILKKIYSPENLKVECEQIIDAAAQKNPNAQETDRSIREILSKGEIRMALTVGVGIQIFQQLVGINTVMYYSSSIMELAGYASHRTALLLSLVVAVINALGTVASILLIDRMGRRKLALSSLIGVTGALILLSVGFHMTTTDSPEILIPNNVFNGELICSSLTEQTRQTSKSLSCLDCLHAQCGFCSSLDSKMQRGSCLIHNATIANMCTRSAREWYTQSCPSKYGWLPLLGLAVYIMAFSPGMGPVPWAINSEIYPTQYRGLCGGVAATANWISNLLVAQSFLSLTHMLGSSGTFALFTCFSVLATIFVFVVVPETKGLSFQEVESLWQERAKTQGWFPWTLNASSYSRANDKSFPMQNFQDSAASRENPT